MNRLHICFLCGEYPPGKHGGIGMLTRTLGRALVKEGHTVSVIGVYPISSVIRENDEGVRIVRVPSSRIRWLGFLQNAARLSRQLCQLAAEKPLDILDGQENAFALVSQGIPGCRVLRINGGHHFFYTSMGAKPRAVRSW